MLNAACTIKVKQVQSRSVINLQPVSYISPRFKAILLLNGQSSLTYMTPPINITY